MTLSDEARARYRRALLDKGMVVATLLADVLAGKDKQRALAALPLHIAKPGMRPEERLRAYLDFIESRRKLLDARDDRFGQCDVCAQPLGSAALDEVPWADRCVGCAAA